jgi:hypothetical protein
MIGKSLAFDACYLAAAVPPPYHSLKCMELLQACNFDLHCFKTIIGIDFCHVSCSLLDKSLYMLLNYFLLLDDYLLWVDANMLV